VNNEKKEWELWEQKLGLSAWKPAENVQYHKMFVPTIDTTRNRLIIWTCLQAKIPILAVGTTGTGKTSLINGLLTELDEPSYMC
jgi:dynein heavy chain